MQRTKRGRETICLPRKHPAVLLMRDELRGDKVGRPVSEEKSNSLFRW